MLPRKLDRKWLSVAIFRIACTADSENVPKVTVYTENSLTDAKEKQARKPVPGHVQDMIKAFPLIVKGINSW